MPATLGSHDGLPSSHRILVWIDDLVDVVTNVLSLKINSRVIKWL